MGYQNELQNNNIDLQTILNTVNELPEASGDMIGATSSSAGTSGLVPAPAAGDQDKFLKGDGTWGEAGTNSQRVILYANNWTTQSDGTYAQSVSVTGVTTDNQVVVDCALDGTDIDADIAVLKDWGYVNRASQASGSLTFYCYGEKPTVSIPLNVVVM